MSQTNNEITAVTCAAMFWSGGTIGKLFKSGRSPGPVGKWPWSANSPGGSELSPIYPIELTPPPCLIQIWKTWSSLRAVGPTLRPVGLGSTSRRRGRVRDDWLFRRSNLLMVSGVRFQVSVNTGNRALIVGNWRPTPVTESSFHERLRDTGSNSVADTWHLTPEHSWQR